MSFPDSGTDSAVANIATANTADGLDTARVTDWLRDHAPNLTGPITFRRLPSGRSNLTYLATDAGGRRGVLRRPPLSAKAATATHLAREWSILTILHHTDVPTPAPIAECTDPAVTGAPFYLMEFLDGITLEGEADTEALTPGSRRALSSNLIEVLAEIHRIDCGGEDFQDFRRDGSYLERQLKLWHRQLGPTAQDVPGLTELHRRLVTNRPEERYVGIVHGDYRPGNFIVTRDGAVEGVLDWELWTVGDVLADLGWLIATWSSPEAVDWAPATTSGFAQASELAAHYHSLTRNDLADLDYYHAFALWKLTCIAVGALSRYLSGAMGEHDVDLRSLRDKPRVLVDQALTILT